MNAVEELNSIAQVVPDAIIDIRYATDNNIAKRPLYKAPLPLLRQEPLDALAFVAAVLRAQGYKFVIFDAYRSPDVQKSLQAVCGDTNYVAAVSNHCRGITVDVTLADVMNTYLDMGTDYDDFTEKAHPDAQDITAEQAQNRRILQRAMEKHGFVVHPNEWWHFDYKPDLSWDLIDNADNVI